MENTNTAMRRDFESRIAQLVEKFIKDENAYSDNVQLQITISDLSLAIVDPEQDLPECDYYPMMDLVRGSSENPGQWEPDPDAIAEVAADYIFAQ